MKVLTYFEELAHVSASNGFINSFTVAVFQKHIEVVYTLDVEFDLFINFGTENFGDEVRLRFFVKIS